jgi:hypothetical protein
VDLDLGVLVLGYGEHEVHVIPAEFGLHAGNQRHEDWLPREHPGGPVYDQTECVCTAV